MKKLILTLSAFVCMNFAQANSVVCEGSSSNATEHFAVSVLDKDHVHIQFADGGEGVLKNTGLVVHPQGREMVRFVGKVSKRYTKMTTAYVSPDLKYVSLVASSIVDRTAATYALYLCH